MLHTFSLQAWKVPQRTHVLGVCQHGSMWGTRLSLPYPILPRDCAGGRRLSQYNTGKSTWVFLDESLSLNWHKKRDQKGITKTTALSILKYQHSYFAVYWTFIELVRGASTILHSLEARTVVSPHVTCPKLHTQDVAQLGGEHRCLTTEPMPLTGAQCYPRKTECKAGCLATNDTNITSCLLVLCYIIRDWTKHIF